MNAIESAISIDTATTDESLLNRVLTPYKKHCRYLQSVEIEKDGDPSKGGRVSGTCRFAIPESCYIDDTGHFNSVEFNICYNQMMYYVIAKSVHDKLMHSFSGWSMDDYWQKQLPDIYIVKFQSSFRSAMASREFNGQIDFTRIRQSNDLIYANTECSYWDAAGGRCEGNVTLAIVN